MVRYNLIVRKNNLYQNNSIDDEYDLDRDQLLGFCLSLYALFGVNSPFVGLYQSDGMRKIDYANQIDSSDTILLSGDKAKEIGSDRWVLDLADRGIKVTKRFSMRVVVNDNHLIIQFSKRDFLAAVITVFDVLNIDYVNHLFDLHENGQPIDIDVREPGDKNKLT